MKMMKRGSEMLYTNTLFNLDGTISNNGYGSIDLVSNAIELLKLYEPVALSMNPKGYWVTSSGGKDSLAQILIYIKAGVKFAVHNNHTTWDPPELVKYNRWLMKWLNEKYDIETYTHYPKETGWQLIIRKGKPPSRVCRYCCDVLKEGGGKGSFVSTGVRWAESRERQNNRGQVEILGSTKKKKFIFSYDNETARRKTENCQIKGKRIINPIVDWKDEDIWEWIYENKMPYCELYDEGFDRLGCVMCPVAGTNQMLIEAARWPKYYENFLRTFEKMLQANRDKTGQDALIWKTKEDVMQWFIYASHNDIDQIELEYEFEAM